MSNNHKILKWMEEEFKPGYPLAGTVESNQYAETIDHNTARTLIDYVELQRDLPKEIKDEKRFNRALKTLERMLEPIDAMVKRREADVVRLEEGRAASVVFDDEFREALGDLYDTFVEKAEKIREKHGYNVDNGWFFNVGQGVQELRNHELFKKQQCS